jgi:hypothetical protein
MAEELVKESLKNDEYTQYYIAATSCWNCHKKITRYLLRGTPMEKCHADCDYCGCINRMSGGK